MDIALIPLASTRQGLSSARLGFERLVAAVEAAEGAFRRLVAGLDRSDPAGGRADPLRESVALERERLRLIGQGNSGYRDQRYRLADIGAAQTRAARQAGAVWAGFGDDLAGTFASLFDRIARDGGVRLGDLFRGLGPAVSDLIGRLTGFDASPLLGALGRTLGGAGGGLGALPGLLGQLVGPLLGPLLGGTGLGSLLPIPGAGLLAAAIPLAASLFADKDYPFAKAGIAATGGRVVADAFELDGGPLDQITRLGDAVAETLQDALDRLGATVGDLADLAAVGYSSGRKPGLPKGFFAGIDATRGADFASGAVFAGLGDPEEAMLRAVQAGLLRAFETAAARGVDPDDAATVTIGLLRAMAAPFTTVDDGLADIAFLRDQRRTLERLNAAGDDRALQRVEVRERADALGAQDAAYVREFLERAARLFAPLNAGDDPADAGAFAARLAAAPTIPEADLSEAYLSDEGRRLPLDGPALPVPITDESSVIGYRDPVVPGAGPSAPGASVTAAPVLDDDDLAALRLAEARAAIDHYVRALVGVGDAVADTRPLTGYALQLVEAEARLEGLSGALREAGYSAEEAAELIADGTAAARARLQGAYRDDLDRDLRGARGLGVVDRVGELVEASDIRRAEGVGIGADLGGIDELLGLQVQALLSAGSLSVAALEAVRVEFAGNAVVTDALGRALAGHTAAANDNAAAQMTLAGVTRLATAELDAQIREQDEVRRSAEAVAEAIADTRRRLDLDPALSILSPRERLEEARLRFEDLAGRSLAGDQAAQRELPEAGETYLKLARDFHASTEDYAKVFRQVDAALRDTGGVADRQLAVAEQQLEELSRLRRALTGEIGELPNPSADFGQNPTRNRILARLTGYAGDFGGGGFGGFRAGLSPEINALVDAIASSIGFADGGLMTAGGPLALHAYAGGGIARRPQLALFGEGRMPEAFVPLPDGRSIPVTVTAPANDRGTGEADPGAARRTAGIEALVEETRRLRAELAGLRGENAALRRGLERIAAGFTTGRAA